MMAIILAGGKGTRLKPFTMTIPKPLLPLGDVPILEVVVRQLAAAGITRIVLTLGHMSHLFAAFIGDGSKWGIKIDYCIEEMPLGTAGALSLVKDVEEDFIVMNGDLLTTIDYRALVEYHRHNEAWGTIATKRREINIDFGVIDVAPDGTLLEYREKPVISYNVSMGINVLSKKCLDFVAPGVRLDMPQLMDLMRNSGKRVCCYQTDCYWQDIGRFDDYQQASADFVSDSARFLP